MRSDEDPSGRLAGLVARAGGRRFALVLLAGLAAAQVAIDDAGWWAAPRQAVFDAYQRAFPRRIERVLARFVDVDEASLRQFGQWPWPRFRLASLIEATAALGPLALGLDIVMSEPDRLSPAELARTHPTLDADLRERLLAVPSNDALLARTLEGAPVVVARVGLERPGSGNAAGRAVRYPPTVTRGGDPLPYLRAFGDVRLNVPDIEAAAAGHGLVNSIFFGDGVVRRVPVIARIGDVVAPSLALEVIRVAIGAPFLVVEVDDRGVAGVQLGDAFLPTNPDGTLDLHFGLPDPRRRISAADVLADRLPPKALAGQVALIGVTALGTADAPPTPVTGRMDGVEIQVQAIESLLTGAHVTRPAFARWAEPAATLAAGGVLVLALPWLGARRGLAALVGILGLLAAGGVGAFAEARLLLDPSYSMASGTVLGVLMFSSMLAAAAREARRLDQALERERLATARLAGELDAARAIQMGILPDPAGLEGLPPELEIDALLEPAREVGGDLYDAFMVDERRLFFLVGDVSGKGIPASLFMAISKALCKSLVLRSSGTVADRISLANEDISRDNPAMLFVTAVAGLLDAETGELELCVAGHDAPCVVRAGAEPREIDSVGGPPLCAMDDFPYPTEHFRVEPGDTLVMTTDGVSEAMDPAGSLYGKDRMMGLLAGVEAGRDDPRTIVRALYDDVQRFAAGTEPNDDITIMAIRFRGGPAGGGRTA